MYIYGDHIKIRMEERGITSDEIEKILYELVPIAVVPSSKDNEIDLVLGEVNNVFLVVVINRETKKLVTVRHMRKNEKKLYKEWISNE